MKIQRLTESVIAAIAAGEVVERPAAALKEIIENSIDGQATKIIINLAEGGLAKMQVTDNGCGISQAELVAAVQPHSTSKLCKAAELENIATLGFRGEALAAIASLSYMTVRSRTNEAANGAELTLRGSWNDEQPLSYVMAFGTQIILRDLFAFAPARRKFMRTERTEWGHCDLVVRMLALAHPEIEIELQRDDKVRLAYKVQTERERVSEVIGKRFAASCKYFESKTEPLRMHGYIDLAALAGGPSRQFIVLNGRCVKDPLLRKAVRKACLDFSPKQQEMPYAIYLDLPAPMVDVNAHPSKLEVRFREPQAVFQFLHKAVQRAVEVPIGFNSDLPLPSVNWAPAQENHPLDHGTQSQQPPLPTNGKQENSQQGLQLDELSSAFSADDTDQKTQDKKLCNMGRPIAVLHGIYLLAENQEGMLVIDIHAAHERLIYEKYKEHAANNIQTQRLLEEIELDLSPLELDTLANHRELLAQLGYVITRQSKMEFLLSLPSLLATKVAHPEQLVTKCLAELAELGTAFVAEEARNKVLATAACHAAIRGSQEHISMFELDSLLRNIERTLNSGRCNHGRPTWRALKLKDLDRFFERGQ